jgi:hypothetical protein
MTPADPLDVYDVAWNVAAALERAGVDYFLGGSLASSLQGEPRATNDIDFVVNLSLHQIPVLARELGTDFEVDERALAEAVRRRSCWNIYFLPLVYKVDLFQKGEGPFDEAEFSRRRPFDLGEGRRIMVKSKEDSVLRKLLWFRRGGEVATHQWRDVVQLLRVAGSLEAEYLRHWAPRLGVEDLLERAEGEAVR